MAIGGDYGGGFTKLGITYTNIHGVEEFSALLVMTGKDNWESLHRLSHSNLLQFTGQSAQFKSIWELFQHRYLFPPRKQTVLLNGDWNFISAIRGLKGASSHNPCPICDIHKNQMRHSQHHLGEHRPSNQSPPLNSIAHPPLLFIQSCHIVPLPLHVFLGLANRMIDKLENIAGKAEIGTYKKEIKSVSRIGSTGLAGVHGLNGNELSKWIKRGLTYELPFKRETHIPIVGQLGIWLEELRENLLDKEKWVDARKNAFQRMVEDIQQNWPLVMEESPFPKLHMLSQCLEFAKKEAYLGRYNESRIESYHAQFGDKIRNSHFNCGWDIAEKMRKSLADIAVALMQPVLKDEIKFNHPTNTAINTCPIKE